MKNIISLSVLIVLNCCTLSAQTYFDPPVVFPKGTLQIKKVECTDSYTKIYFKHRNEYSGDTGWVNIKQSASIVVNGDSLDANNGSTRKLLKLIEADGIPISPNKFHYNYTNQSMEFTLLFPPLPKDAESISFYECPDNVTDCFSQIGVLLDLTFNYLPLNVVATIHGVFQLDMYKMKPTYEFGSQDKILKNLLNNPSVTFIDSQDLKIGDVIYEVCSFKYGNTTFSLKFSKPKPQTGYEGKDFAGFLINAQTSEETLKLFHHIGKLLKWNYNKNETYTHPIHNTVLGYNVDAKLIFCIWL